MIKANKMKKVAIFRWNILPLSETFIRDNLLSLSSWEGILIGGNEVTNGLEIDPDKKRVIKDTNSKIKLLLNQLLWREIIKLTQLLKEENIKLVHAHFGFDAIRIWPSVKKIGLPMLVTLHGYDISIKKTHWFLGKGGIQNIFYPFFLKHLSKQKQVTFIAVSENIKKQAISFGIPEHKIKVRFLGIDDTKFKEGSTPIQQRKNRILFVGRMVEKKSPLLMVEIFSNIKKIQPDAELIMIGTGPLLANAKTLAKKLNIEIDFQGARSSEYVKNELEQAKVFCLPSVTAANGDTEGLPISILEALTCGIPVVTSAKGGVDEAVINGLNGFCFDENDKATATSSILKLLQDEDTLINCSSEAKKRVTDCFSFKDTIKALEKLYEKQVL